MQATLSATSSARPTFAKRSVQCSATPRPETHRVSRRSAAAFVGILPALAAGAAFAKDAEDSRRAAEERKAALKAAATGMKETGKPEEVFKDSKYAVSEDKSPNVHTRQEEGVRKSGS